MASPPPLEAWEGSIWDYSQCHVIVCYWKLFILGTFAWVLMFFLPMFSMLYVVLHRKFQVWTLHLKWGAVSFIKVTTLTCNCRSKRGAKIDWIKVCWLVAFNSATFRGWAAQRPVVQHCNKRHLPDLPDFTRLCPALMLTPSGYGPSPADKVSLSAVLALGFVRQFGIVSPCQSIFSTEHLADRRLWWSGNGRHGNFSPASTQTPLATTLEAGKVIRCFQLQSYSLK